VIENLAHDYTGKVAVDQTDEQGSGNRLSAVVGDDQAGLRLDQAVAQLFPDYSRSRLTAWIKDGRVTVEGEQRRPRDKVMPGECLVLLAEAEPQVACVAQDIPLDIRFEDRHVLVINKPAGLVVHPAAGNPDGTLQNALLFHSPALVNLPRGGIVHRLDKDTTGLMVVAKSDIAHKNLVAALQARDVHREYRALVAGELIAGGTIDQPIGRHPTVRTRMAVHPTGKPAVTHYRVEEHFRGHTLLDVRLETGRTHQIRVHMAFIRHPVFGDPVYGGRLRLPARADQALVDAMRAFKRQALHAYRLGFHHPVSGEELAFEAEIPDDMAELVALLREDAEAHGWD
jgi:23S rRNA pseudouridine1911/1915/1917 synthase